ncbi:ubiquinone biosynthesis accessory factor UbiJ [Lacimicrobium alkaliphilum]|uniref:Ubiquinone biosynthesis accessory factor UbiJ n=1 Tax=Lacimicrobium alkaliphilum TaxID=1526571 RepID=A0ABQ1RQ21_9ALTE|nr:SCP2 sterol-binding domain-containing protein [Lacimicrobium alkaliphilum]GGD76499.1 SCP2 domain-containing protein [Lacimicrobium alkaliphilum]
MPAPQLLTAGIELALNKLLALDPASQQRLIPLNGKRLRVNLDELPWPLTFAFSDRVDILTDEHQVDCTIELSVTTLQKLQDVSQLSLLIQQQELSLNGDMHTAQSFSNLIKELDIDWEEHLSRYTGDVIAHQSFKTARRFHHAALSRLHRFGEILRDTAMDEKQLSAHPLAVETFSEQVNQLRSDVARFEARLLQLEQQKGK